MHLGKIIETINVFRKTAVRVNTSKDATTLYRLGLACKDKSKFDLAIKYFKQATKIDPNHADAHYNLGCIYLKQGRLNKAIISYKTVITINPDHALAHDGLWIIYSKLGRMAEAESEFETARQLKI